MMESALKGGVWRDRDFTHFLFFFKYFFILAALA